MLFWRRPARIAGSALPIILIATIACSPAAPTPPAAAPTPPAAAPTTAPPAPPTAVAAAPVAPAPSTAASASASPAVSASVVAPSPSAVAAPAAPGGLQPVRVAVPTKGTAFSYLYVGKDLGIFEKYGLDLQIVQITPANSVVALTTGELDFAATVGSAGRSALRGLPVRVILVGLNYTDFLILGADGVTSLDQLRGQPISTDAPGTTSYDIAQELLRRHGLQPGDYTPVTATDDPARAAALNGVAKAAIMEAGSTALALERQGHAVLADAQEVQVPFVGLAASQAAIQGQPDLVRRSVQATLEALQVMRDAPDQVLPIIQQEYGLSSEDAASIYDELQSGWQVDGRPSSAAMQFEFQSDQRDLNLDQPVTQDQIYDFSVLDQIAAAR